MESRRTERNDLVDKTPFGKRRTSQDVHSGGVGATAGIEPGNILFKVDAQEVAPPEHPHSTSTIRWAPVDAFKKHRHLRACERQSTAPCRGSYEPAALETHQKQAQSITVCPKEFCDGSAAASEDEHMPGQMLLPQRTLHLSTEAIATMRDQRLP